MKNLLLIDSTVKDYQTFVDSVNADTVPFVYGSSTTVPFIELPEDILSDPSYVEMPREPYVHKQATTRQSIFDFLGNTTIDRIGIVSTMSARVFLEGETFFEETNVQFVLELIQRYQVKNMDYLACNTLQYQEWNDYFSRISETGVLVGASNNKTGNLQYGGDWILESTNQDVELIYFTNTIEHYKYLLDTSDTGYSTVVIKDTYNVWGSGSNAKNQLGNLGSTTQTTNYSTFRKLSNANSCNRVVCSVNFTMFTSYEKAVGFWSGNNWLHGSGSNEDGQLSPYSGIQFTLVGPSANGQGYRYAMGAGEFFSMSQDDEPITKGQGIPDYAYKQFYNASWIACGRAHSLLIHKVSSYLYGTGLNNNYQLGMGNTSTYTSYVIVSSNKYVANACGSYHSLALRDDGTIWGAGLNSSNQLGSLYGTNTTFVQISPANKIFVAIAAGETHSLALNIDGTVWGTGSNAYNQLGTMYGSSTTFAQLTPTGTVFRQVSCGSYGSYHSLALDSNNNLWGTGLNATNQLGSAYGSSTTFVQILTGVAVLSNISPSYIDPIYISYLFTLSANTNIIPGNQLTIYGTNLASVAYVTYRGIQVMAASFTSISQFNIVFTVPTGTTVSNFLTINVGGVNYPATNSAINTVTSPQPTITTITQAANGLVTINGTNFNTPTVTMTGGFTVNNFSKVSSTQLTFNASSFIGTTTFTVTDSGSAVSLTQSFPTITTITQAANGLVTINGNNFNTPTVTMTDGFTVNNFSKVSSTQLTFNASSFIGTTTFTVTDSGSTVSLTQSFPTITTITQAANGVVTINGTNFNTPTVTMTGGFTVNNFSKVSSTQLTFNSNSFIGSTTFTVTDSGNAVSLTQSFPTITTITQAANGLVTINGTNFNTPTVTMTGGFTVNNFSKVSSTQLTFNSNSFIGSTTFTVTDSGNAVSFSQSFPTITTITQAANGVVTINGTNFNTPTVTMTGGFTPNNFSKVSASQLTFTSSSFIGSTTFTVTDSGSTVSLIKTFPTITSFTPGSGTKNVIVTITGSNLSNVTTVVFGTISAISPFISANTITANAPPNVKSVFITLSDNEGNSVTTTTSFTYNTNSTLFTTNVSNNNLLTQLSLTDGVADTGIIQIGSALTTTNFSGPVYGTTVNASDNSSTLATTAFVKSQGYVTSLTVYAQTAVAQTWSALQNFSTITASSPALSDNSSSVATTAFVKGQGYVTSLTGYAQLAAAQTWSAIQTFNSGVLSSKYDALNSSSALSLGSNLATGIVNIGTSTSITNLSGTTYGVTVNASDNSSSVATTAFVKAQNYSTGSANLSSYAQLNASQTWTAPQTFNSVIYSSMYEALNTSADVYLGNNITTGNVYIGAGLNAGSVTLIGGNPQSYTYLQGLSTATGPLDISENSTRIATTAFVKAQNYAKTAVAQTWSAAQTFSSGITATLTGSSKISVPVNVGNIDIMYGNTNTSASLGYSFNTKSSTASGTNQPVQLFSLVNTTPTGGVQYFELNITGHVASLGATGQRLAIWIYGVGTGSNPGGNSVFLLGYNIGSGSFLNVDFTPNTAILRFTPPGSNGYSLCATLTSYPTMGSPGNMTDWAVTAL